MYKQLVQHHKTKLRITLTLFLSFLFALGMFTVPMQAQALGLNVTLASCTGTHTATWSPGVTNTVKQITVTTNSQWSICSQLQLPLLTSASSNNSFTASFSCASLLSPVPATWTIQWGDGALPNTSTYQFTSNVNAVQNNLVITATGPITAGRYAGSTGVATFVLQNLNATMQNLCNTAGGVTSASGISTFVITGLPL